MVLHGVTIDNVSNVSNTTWHVQASCLCSETHHLEGSKKKPNEIQKRVFHMMKLQLVASFGYKSNSRIWMDFTCPSKFVACWFNPS